MEKEFIPYELALALKELGFDEPCFRGWSMEKQVFYHPDSDIVLDNPTFSQAFRFFREEHKLSCSIELIDNSRHYYFDFTIYDSENRDYNDEDCFDSCKRIYNDRKFGKYEEAELEALKKLIEIVKNK